MGSWESNWTPLRAADPSQLIFPAGGSPPRARRRGYQLGWAPHRATGLLRDERSHTNCTDTPGKAELKHSPASNVENKTAEPLASVFTSRTDSRHGIWQSGLPWTPTVLESAKHLVLLPQFIPPSENISEAFATHTSTPAKQVVPLAPRGIGKLSNKPQKHRKYVRKTPTRGLTSSLPPRCPVR